MQKTVSELGSQKQFWSFFGDVLFCNSNKEPIKTETYTPLVSKNYNIMQLDAELNKICLFCVLPAEGQQRY